MKQQIYSLLKGTAQAFIISNLFISLLAYTVYPDFFYPGLLLRAQFLVLTVPLSVALHLQVKYFRRYLEGSQIEIREEFEEVKPDLGR
ncbi:hypothetical protein KY092_08355 [Natronomonas gomsonensis]|uniref:hypothetical protein n=1 Tax=Natronomonas gomsonensis TaxID=1046043 RepID=UPI0020CA514D|nr:hypothetical protein [Natronomonas gomsonensis]MCY4730569.1 hypothetical protein [Natronomonas gomsonensis]